MRLVKKYLPLIGAIHTVFIFAIFINNAPTRFLKKTGEKKFACALNCMDGRVQDAVSQYIKKTYGITYVDMVTEAGPNKILADKTNTAIVENIKDRVWISFHHHKSNLLFIAAHEGCAGNPAPKEEQIKHLIKAKKTTESFGFGGKIILLWVSKKGTVWKAEEVK